MVVNNLGDPIISIPEFFGLMAYSMSDPIISNLNAILNAAAPLTKAYWLPITATIIIGLLILCCIYLKSRPYTKYSQETWFFIWFEVCACIAFSAFLVDRNDLIATSKVAQIRTCIRYIICFLFIIVASCGPSIASNCINWMKERDLRYLALNLSNKWFDWLKWTTIIATVSYIQVQTSDEILKVIVTISYLALFINISIPLFPIFKNLFNRTLDFNWLINGTVTRYYVVLCTYYLSFFIILSTYIIISYVIDKIQEAAPILR